MPSAVLQPVGIREPSPPPRKPRAAIVIAVVAAACLCAAIAIAAAFWPFRQRTVVHYLQQETDSVVSFHGFHNNYFPLPGCVLDDVEFRHGTKGSEPLITAARLVIQGTYAGFLSRRLKLIRAEGLHVNIPTLQNIEPFHIKPVNVTIGEITANDAVLDVERTSAEKPLLRVEIPEASAYNVTSNGSLSYRVRLNNTDPPAVISAAGRFGPWDRNGATQTAVSGEYTVEKLDLGSYEPIAGVLSSRGKFDGVLENVEISGSTDVPEFEVRMSERKMHVAASFRAQIDAVHGGASIQEIDAHFGHTQVIAEGNPAKFPAVNGAFFDFALPDGRIEDILRLFVKANRPPMSGEVTVRARAEVQAGGRNFPQNVRLHGVFGVGGGTFSRPEIQARVDKLSAGASGEKIASDPETVLTDLSGPMALENGVIRFADLSFAVPGAKAHLHGTYSLMNSKIDLRGEMKVDAKIANTASGPKALLLKFMDPFFKKKPTGEILPVRISGTFEHPSFGLDLADKKADLSQQQKQTTPSP